MIFRITLKDPDGVHDGIKDAIYESLNEIGLPKDEQEALYEIRDTKISEFVGKWIDGGEYLTVEFDTEKGTAIVVPD